MTPSMNRHIALAFLALVALGTWTRLAAQQRAQPARAAQPAPAAPGTPDSAALAQIRWRYIGPVGNRVSAVAGVPGDPSTYYAGAASGGLWKTTDGGVHWESIFDAQPVQSIGQLAVAPSDPNVVWAGT